MKLKSMTLVRGVAMGQATVTRAVVDGEQFVSLLLAGSVVEVEYRDHAGSPLRLYVVPVGMVAIAEADRGTLMDVLAPSRPDDGPVNAATFVPAVTVGKR